jgi:hypothetical protein
VDILAGIEEIRPERFSSEVVAVLVNKAKT